MNRVILIVAVMIGFGVSANAHDGGKKGKKAKASKEMKAHQCSEACKKDGKCAGAHASDGKSCQGHAASSDAKGHQCSEACKKEGKCAHHGEGHSH